MRLIEDRYCQQIKFFSDVINDYPQCSGWTEQHTVALRKILKPTSEAIKRMNKMGLEYAD
jgi:hypothetical protein